MCDSSEGILYCSQKAQVSLMQMDLKFCFGIRIRLVDGITLLAPGGWNRTFGFGACDRHFPPSFQQHPLISVQIFLIHFRFPDTACGNPQTAGNLTPMNKTMSANTNPRQRRGAKSVESRFKQLRLSRAPRSTMKELVEAIAKALVDNPDQVQVRAVEGDLVTVFELRVHVSDLGKVIGRQGRTAQAIRTILTGVGLKLR